MKCIFVGYVFVGYVHPIWYIEDRNNLKFVISRDLTFESTMCNRKGSGTSFAGNDKDASQKV